MKLAENETEEDACRTADAVCERAPTRSIETFRRECLVIAGIPVSDRIAEYDKAYYMRVCEILFERARKGERNLW